MSLSFVASAQPAEDEADSLWNDATLYRDEWGVPHIYADDLRAMAFAFGYAQAEDHLDEMLLAYRAANGRSAEVLGEDRVPQDTYAIRMRFGELAREAFNAADREVFDICEGFALGVNTWLLEHPDNAPPWAEGVQPHDILALLHMFEMAQAPFDLPEADVRDPGMISAHAWAVAPERSVDGGAMLVANPHGHFDGVFRWYEARLEAEDYALHGATLYGLPLLLLGYNDRLAWTFAPNGADTADLFDHQNYAFIEQLADHRKLFVNIDGILEPRDIPIWNTAMGPVVAANMGRPLSWRVGGYGEFNALGQLLDMGMALDLTDFGDALEARGFPAMNVLYADREGNTFYLYHARGGVRRSADPDAPVDLSTWEKPVLAASDKLAWGDPIRLSAMPAVWNPEGGYIVASGAPPWRTTSSRDIDRRDYPEWLVRDQDHPASRRAREVLEIGPRSFRDMQALLFDEVAPEAGPAVRALIAAAKSHPRIVRAGHPDLPAALDMLADWNFLASPDSPEMTLFHIWQRLLLRTLGEDGFIPDQEGESAKVRFEQTILRAASDAARLMANTYQTIFVPWGEAHVLRRGEHTVALGGGSSGSPIFYSGDAVYSRGQWSATSGYAYGLIVRFGDSVQAVTVSPFGASERPDSPHYADQLALMRDGRMRVAPTSRDEVKRAAVSATGTRLEFVGIERRVRLRVVAEQPVHARMVRATRFSQAPPEELVAYSPYVEPVVDPADAYLRVDLIFSIPDAICAREDLGELAVYSYHPETGWLVVEEQATDEEARALRASDYYPQVYVVLGPKANRRTGAVARPAVALLEDTSDRDTTARGTVVGVARGFEPAARDPLGEALADDAVRRKAPRPMQSPIKNPFGASESVLRYERPVPKSEPTPEHLELPDGQRAELVPKSSSDIPTQRSAPDPGQPAEMNSDPDDKGYEVERAEDGAMVIRGSRASDPDAPRQTARLSYSDAIPERTHATQQSNAFQFQLAPDQSLASPMRIGTNVELATPDGNALFHVAAERQIRAQAFLTPEAPAPLPNGLVNFTQMYTVRHEDRAAAVTTAVFLRVSPEVCGEEDAAQLLVFAYDSTDGWQPLQNTQRTSSLNFQAFDRDSRIYAVLGPAALRRVKP